MDFNDFSKDSDVQAFVRWFREIHAQLPINLKVRSTGYVPGGISTRIVGFGNVLEHYRWKSRGMATGDWIEAISVLNCLSRELTTAVDRADATALRDAIRRILIWGGNRRWDQGAWQFAASLTDQELIAYLRSTRALLQLSAARLPLPTGEGGVLRMNAMLTKVHALNAADGLPIYDSRVAAAIASLVELWRIHEDIATLPLPLALTFASTDPARTASILSNAVVAPPSMGTYKNPDIAWADCKVRLGWLIMLILDECEDLFSDVGKVNRNASPTAASGTRPHAFESTLFMIGYDPACLLPTSIRDDEVSRRRFASIKRGSSSIPKDPAKYPFLTSTITGKEAHIRYRFEQGNIEVLRKNTRLTFGEETIEEILSLVEAGGGNGTLLAASQDGVPPSGSLGELLKSRGYSPQDGSAIAAILCDQGLLTSKGKRPVRLFQGEVY